MTKHHDITITRNNTRIKEIIAPQWRTYESSELELEFPSGNMTIYQWRRRGDDNDNNNNNDNDHNDDDDDDDTTINREER